MAIAIAVVKNLTRMWLRLNPTTDEFIRNYICAETHLGVADLCLLISLLSDILPDDSFLKSAEDHPNLKYWKTGELDLDETAKSLRQRFIYIDKAFRTLEKSVFEYENEEKIEDLTALFSLLVFTSHIHEI